MTFPLRRVSAFLFFSGACALVYQVAWFRELRLIFGASTAASAAVLAVFMGGLGVGGLFLGKRADRVKNPLALYGHLELIVALTAGVSPLLVLLARAVYLGIGGSSALGTGGATVARLLLAVVVLGPSTIAMGGTLPAAARAVERASDAGRQRVATLYGVNTMGAVVGTVAANFLLMEVFGSRMTLWLACLVNALVAVFARSAARTVNAVVTTDHAEVTDGAIEEPRARIGRWFPPFAAAVAGLSFLLMELVWYRMLAPLLGGSSYTFGLILAIALTGIGIGGALYSRTRRPATLTVFALTCSLEALALALPYALGDRVALLALLLRPLAQASFGGAVTAWGLVASIVVLPGAIVSGYQFPAVIGLYGRGAKDVGRDVGAAYLANTVGSIVGSVAGGFGLVPLLSAPRCWQLVVVVLLASAMLTSALQLRAAGKAAVPALAVSTAFAGLAALAIGARGPTATWRHSGIGAGRADALVRSEVSRWTLAAFERTWQAGIRWEEDGLESSVALGHKEGFVFIVNGKADGHVLVDAGTQVMSGMVPALLHPDPKSALVIGLGTGSTAGWLGAVPSIERVDVMELEPAIVRVARDCAPVNHDVIDNPKVKIHLGDAREGLLTTRQRYDIVVSEPSNPYRAGISSLYTVEYYESVAERLNPNGLFVQWVQTYEVDPFVIATTAMTVRQIFPSVMLWQTESGDLVLVAGRTPAPIDVDRLRARLLQEPFASAAAAAWMTTSAEGVLARFVARPDLVDLVAEHRLGVVNHDDQNALEFAFARHVGTHAHDDDGIRSLAARLRVDIPTNVIGSFDLRLLYEERMLEQLHDGTTIDLHLESPPPDLLALGRVLQRLEDDPAALAAWDALARRPRSHHEALLVLEALARAGDDRFPAALDQVGKITAERDLLRAIWLIRRARIDEGVAALENGFVAARSDPWVRASVMQRAMTSALEVGAKDPARAGRLARALSRPFAVEAFREQRLRAHVVLAHGARDAKLCVEALDAAAPLPMDRTLYETRVLCYRATKDPRLADAEVDLGLLLSFSRPFGADIER